MPRPGVIIYFEILSALEKLSDEQAGSLFKGILQYARDDIVPYFDDPMVDLMWCLMQSAIDRDGVRYDDSVKSSRYSTYCRECKKYGVNPGSHEEWMALSDAEINQLFTHLKSRVL